MAAVREIRSLVRKFNPAFICLSETKISDIQPSMNRVGFCHFISHPHVGRRGGVVFAWLDGLDVELISIN